MTTVYFTDEVKTRVTEPMKSALVKLAEAKELDLSDIVREALRDYLEKRERESEVAA